MRFLLDESVDYPQARFLTELGYDVTALAHDHPCALKDRDVLATALEERRILIINDRDFGEVIFRKRLSHVGVTLFRLGREDLSTRKAWLAYVLEHYSRELNDFVIMTDGRIRVRRA